MKQILSFRTVIVTVTLFILFLAIGTSGAGEWSALGSGTNNWVRAVAVGQSGVIYAGGDFDTAGGVPANHIARWNGFAWSALGTGTNGIVTGLVTDGAGNLYATGPFSDAGGVELSRIARWDGSAWHKVGTGNDDYPRFGSDIECMAVDSSGNLYVGGTFTVIRLNYEDSITVNHIAKFDGTSWSALGTGMNGNVYDLAFDNFGNLYACGNFTEAGGVTVNRLAMWNGSSWSDVGGGVNGYGYAMAFGGGNLYVGGKFSSVGPDPLNAIRIARWDTTSSTWNKLASGVGYTIDQTPGSLVFDGTNLYAGGYFLSAGSVYANYIAKWDGTEWSLLGDETNNGTNYSVTDMALIGSGSIVISGCFSQAGAVSVNNIARWDETPQEGTTTPVVAPWLHLLFSNQAE